MVMFVLAPNNECIGLTKRSSGKLLAEKTDKHTVRRNLRNNDIETSTCLEEKIIESSRWHITSRRIASKSLVITKLFLNSSDSVHATMVACVLSNAHMLGPKGHGTV